MTNVELIKKEIENRGYEPGIVSDDLNRLSEKELKHLMDRVSWGDYHDIGVKIRNRRYMVETCFVDMGTGVVEVDFVLMSWEVYEGRYEPDYTFGEYYE